MNKNYGNIIWKLSVHLFSQNIAFLRTASSILAEAKQQIDNVFAISVRRLRNDTQNYYNRRNIFYERQREKAKTRKRSYKQFAYKNKIATHQFSESIRESERGLLLLRQQTKENRKDEATRKETAMIVDIPPKTTGTVIVINIALLCSTPLSI